MQRLDNLSAEQLRKTTRLLGQAQSAILTEYLAMLGSLTRPAPLFGEFVRGGSVSASQTTSKLVSDLKTTYGQVAAAKPFNDVAELKAPLDIQPAGIELQPFQYRHAVSTPERGETVTVTAPLKFVPSYRGYPISAFRSLIAQPDAAQESVRGFLLHTLLLNFVFTRQPGFKKILEGLGYQVSSNPIPGFGALPWVFLSVGLPTVRPSDARIIEMIEKSEDDVVHVREVLDRDAIANLRHPLQDQIAAMLSGADSGSREAA